MKNASLKNPIRWLSEEITRIGADTRRAAARLREAATSVKETIHEIVASDPPLLLEILVLWIHRLVAAAIESAVNRLLRKITRPKPPRIFVLRPPDAAT